MTLACLGLLLLSVGLVLIGCVPPAGSSLEPVPPAGKLVGPFAFSDPTGRVSLGSPCTKSKGFASRALQEILGTLAVKRKAGGTACIGATGTYDDISGRMSEIAIVKIA